MDVVADPVVAGARTRDTARAALRADLAAVAGELVVHHAPVAADRVRGKFLRVARAVVVARLDLQVDHVPVRAVALGFARAVRGGDGATTLVVARRIGA